MEGLKTFDYDDIWSIQSSINRFIAFFYTIANIRYVPGIQLLHACNFCTQQVLILYTGAIRCESTREERADMFWR